MPTPQDYRNLELDHAAATSVARGATTFGAFLKVGVPLGAVGLAAFMIYQSLYGPKGPTTNPDREEFRTTQYPGPHLEAPRAQVDTGRFTVPPPEPAPPPPPPPPIAPPVATLSPPFAPPDDGEARRLAELERQRREEEERRKWERLRAPQVVADNADAAMPGRAGVTMRTQPVGRSSAKTIPTAGSSRAREVPALRSRPPRRTTASMP